MKIRVLTALGLAAVGIPVLIFSKYIVFPITIALFALIAVYEMMGLTGFRRKIGVCIPAYLSAAAVPIAAFFLAEKYMTELVLSVFILLFGMLLYLFGYSVIKKGRVKFSDISAHYMTTLYITVSFGALSLIRYIPNGVYYFILVFVASWVCDIFAYFVGRAIGRHKLIPEVSPKKTVEGAIGGVVFTTLAFVLYGYIVTLFEGAPAPNYIILAILGFLLSIVAQFGDLIASLIKREHGIKDYGRIFPGHGGVMDRFDSILAVAPVLLVICIFFPPFN